MSDEFTSSTTDPSPAPAAEPTPQAAPSSPTTHDPAGQSATPSAPGSYQYQEDRSNWVPPHRVRETRETVARQAQEQYAQREAQYQAQLEATQRQLHALVGASPSQQTEGDVVRQQFTQLFPGLAQLEQRAQDVMGLIDQSGELAAQSQHYWQQYGRQSLDRLYAHAERSYGGRLTPEARQGLHAAFTGYIASNPQLQERYASDPTVVDEYWMNFSKHYIDPIRRAQSAQVQNATAPRALPREGRSGVPPSQAPPKPANLDERSTQAWASYQAHRNQS